MQDLNHLNLVIEVLKAQRDKLNDELTLVYVELEKLRRLQNRDTPKDE